MSKPRKSADVDCTFPASIVVILNVAGVFDNVVKSRMSARTTLDVFVPGTTAARKKYFVFG